MFTTHMIRLFAVVLSRDAERVTETLLREGVMQFITITPVEGTASEKLNTVNTQSSLGEITELRRRIEGFLHPIGIYPDPPKEIDLNNRTAVSCAQERDSLDKLDQERERVRERQRVVQQEVLKLEDIKRQVSLYGLGFSDITLHAQHSFIAMQIGRIPSTRIQSLQSDMKDLPSVVLPIGEEGDTTHLLVISMKRDDHRVREILNGTGWTPVELPQEMRHLKSDITDDLTNKLEKLIAEQKNLNRQVQELVEKERVHLQEVWTRLRVNELIFKIQSFFKQSSRTMVFSGWLPASKKDRLTEKIMAASEGRCYLEWHEGEEAFADTEKPPVQFRNPKALAPFQMLVSNFGIPEYGTIDPTPFVMPLYLSMFGLMFADVGQGIILALLGCIGAFFFSKQRGKEAFLSLSHLIIWCGSSSILFGILFGSYFGMGWFKPLWFDFHGIVSGHAQESSLIKDIYDVLAITLFFGIAVILLGLIFNWVNCIRKKAWFELLLKKGGVLGGWIYVCGGYLGYVMVRNNYQLPAGNLVMALIGIPVVLLFMKEPLHYWNHHKEKIGNNLILTLLLHVPEFVLNWLIEIVEIFSRYLSNTLSFLRVAGLGIAHVSLMISFFTLADMAGGKGVGPVFILIAGNILVICLEGLSAGIQALRLNYYEFFTKFFHGTGKLYSPVSLSSRD